MSWVHFFIMENFLLTVLLALVVKSTPVPGYSDSGYGGSIPTDNNSSDAYGQIPSSIQPDNQNYSQTQLPSSYSTTCTSNQLSYDSLATTPTYIQTSDLSNQRSYQSIIQNPYITASQTAQVSNTAAPSSDTGISPDSFDNSSQTVSNTFDSSPTSTSCTTSTPTADSYSIQPSPSDANISSQKSNISLAPSQDIPAYNEISPIQSQSPSMTQSPAYSSNSTTDQESQSVSDNNNNTNPTTILPSQQSPSYNEAISEQPSQADVTYSEPSSTQMPESSEIQPIKSTSPSTSHKCKRKHRKHRKNQNDIYPTESNSYPTSTQNTDANPIYSTAPAVSNSDDNSKPLDDGSSNNDAGYSNQPTDDNSQNTNTGSDQTSNNQAGY